eukprot:Nk52_evm3s250 gene=Nk52_evmTU3s250
MISDANMFPSFEEASTPADRVTFDRNPNNVNIDLHRNLVTRANTRQRDDVRLDYLDPVLQIAACHDRLGNVLGELWWRTRRPSPLPAIFWP